MSLKRWQRFGDDTEGFETVDGLTEHGPRKRKRKTLKREWRRHLDQANDNRAARHRADVVMRGCRTKWRPAKEGRGSSRDRVFRTYLSVSECSVQYPLECCCPVEKFNRWAVQDKSICTCGILSSVGRGQRKSGSCWYQ